MLMQAAYSHAGATGQAPHGAPQHAAPAPLARCTCTITDSQAHVWDTPCAVSES